MRLKSALFALPLSLLLLAPHASFADNLKLTSTAGGSTDGIAVFPYVFTVTIGSSTTSGVDLSCLSFDREIQIGESWAVNTSNLGSLSSAIDGSSLIALREDAFLDALYNTGFAGATNSEIQFAIWDILDPADVHSESGFDAISKALVLDAQNAQASETTAFLSQFTLFTPVVPAGDTDPTDPRNWKNPASWDGNGEPQEFLEYIPGTPNGPPASAPEPSSLLLFGTGLIGTVGMLKRRMQKTAA